MAKGRRETIYVSECEYCGTSFKHLFDAKYCSHSCRAMAYVARNRYKNTELKMPVVDKPKEAEIKPVEQPKPVEQSKHKTVATSVREAQQIAGGGVFLKQLREMEVGSAIKVPNGTITRTRARTWILS